MELVIDGVKYELDNEKFNEVFKEQKKKISGLIDEFEAKDDVLGMYYALISLSHITTALFERQMGKYGSSLVVDLLGAKKIK